jgi:dTMP kinase
MSKGKFYAFEGIDGAGKSSIIKAIAAKMAHKNFAYYITAEPTTNHIGTIIREILLGKREGHEQTIASLFLADRVDHLTNSEYGINGKLAQGLQVLCDRYYLSSYAYHVPHVTLEWVIAANSICAAHHRPDITFYIDITVEESLRRLTASRAVLDRFENEQRITSVRNNYFAAIDKVKHEENIIIINGMQPLSNVIDEVWMQIKEK